MTFNIDTTTDHDNAIAETGVHHEQPVATDWAVSDVVEKGYPSDWSRSDLPTPDHYWPFDEDSGSTATDVIGSLDGTYVGAGPDSTGVGDGVLDTTAPIFDGTDDEIRVGYSSQPIPLTWSIWVYITGNVSDFQPIYGNYRSGGSNDLYIAVNNSGVFFVHDDAGLGETRGSLTTDAWYHLAFVIDGSVARGYINGAEVLNVADTVTSTEDNGSEFHVAKGPGASSQAISGRADELLTWTSALSAPEIQTLYEVGI